MIGEMKSLAVQGLWNVGKVNLNQKNIPPKGGFFFKPKFLQNLTKGQNPIFVLNCNNLIQQLNIEQQF